MHKHDPSNAPARRPSWLRPSRLAAAVAVLLVAAGVAVRWEADPEKGVEIRAAGNQVGDSLPPFEDTTTSSAPTTTTASPATTTTARPRSVPPTTTAPKPSGGTSSVFGPRPPGTVVIPYEAGRTSWEGVSNGVSLRVRISPAAPRAGEPVRFTVEASGGDQPCCGVYVLFGDGGGSSWKAEWPAGDCSTAVPGTVTGEYTHTYNKAGRWEFMVQGITGNCGVNNRYGSLHGYLSVAPGVARSQGPALPTVKVSEARAPSEAVEPGFLKVWAQGTDDDGFVSRFVIDFGDGTTTETRPGDPMGCRPTPSGWPARSLASMAEPYPSHRYAAPGSYTITVTVISTGCDGGEEQSASATLPYVW